MKRLVTLTAVVALGAFVFTPLAWAEDVHGKIKSVDPTGRMVMLEDGTTLSIPSNVRVDRKELQPGAEVKASYQVVGTQKILTSIEVTPSGKK